jgi:hypothetical protein
MFAEQLRAREGKQAPTTGYTKYTRYTGCRNLLVFPLNVSLHIGGLDTRAGSGRSTCLIITTFGLDALNTYTTYSALMGQGDLKVRHCEFMRHPVVCNLQHQCLVCRRLKEGTTTTTRGNAAVDYYVVYTYVVIGSVWYLVVVK